MLGAAQAVWRTSGAKVDQTNAYGMFDLAASDYVRGVIGTEAYEEAFADGAAYSFEQAVAIALGTDLEPEPIAATPPRNAPGNLPGGLTKRQTEIALLLADGLTNREIADRLVISQRTAETHVDHILSKLGVSSRTRVASWVAEHLAQPTEADGAGAGSSAGE